MSIAHRTLLAAVALIGGASAIGRARRRSQRAPVATEVRPRTRTVCANVPLVMSSTEPTARTHAAAPTRVAVCAVTSAGCA